MDNLGALLYGQGLNSFQPGIQLSPDASGAPPVPQELAAGMAPQAAPQPMPQVAPQVAPQAPPQEDGGFLSLIEKVRSDPALSQAALMAGVRLAQGARPGQTVLGLLGDTVQMGTTAYQMMKGNERAQEMQDQKFAADQAREGAVTEGIQLGNKEKLGTLPANIRAAMLRAEALARKGEIEKASQIFDVAEASLRSTYAGTDQGAIDMLAGIRQQILNPVTKENRAAAESASQIDLRAAQVGHIGSQMETEKDKRENPGKYSQGTQSANVEWFNRQVEVEMSKGVPRAQAEQVVLSRMSTRNTMSEPEMRLKHREGFAPGAAGQKAAEADWQANFASFFPGSPTAKREQAAPPAASGTTAPQKQAQGAPAVVGGVLTPEHVNLVIENFSPAMIRADAAARNLTFSPEAEAILKQREARSKGK